MKIKARLSFYSNKLNKRKTMHILKLKSSKFYVKIIGSMQILGTTPLNLQENIKAFKEIEARKGK